MDRAGAAAIALVTGAGIVLRAMDAWATDLVEPDAASLAWYMVRTFTVLTNALVFVTFARIALTGWRPGAAWVGGVTCWILIVGIVYHLLLAKDHSPEGLGVWSNQLLHYVSPALTLIWWAIWGRGWELRLSHAVAWLAWPAAYCLYALGRGLVTDYYPYFFINPVTQGWDGVARWTALLLVAFFLGGATLVGAGRVTGRIKA